MIFKFSFPIPPRMALVEAQMEGVLNKAHFRIPYPYAHAGVDQSI